MPKEPKEPKSSQPKPKVTRKTTATGVKRAAPKAAPKKVTQQAVMATAAPTAALAQEQHSSHHEQLPLWANELRGIPTAFAMSALFTVGNPSAEREYHRRKEVASAKGFTITYTGDTLLQSDQDVFLEIVHISRVHPLGAAVKFTAHALIKQLGWTRNKTSYKRLIDTIDRLAASSISITYDQGLRAGKRGGYTGSLVRSFRWREEADSSQLREWEILLEPEIVALFGPGTFFRTEWALRLKLPPLAKYLHSFYQAQIAPPPYAVAELHRLTASKITELRMFRSKLKQALELLVRVGFLTTAFVDPRSDMVLVEKSQKARLLLSQDQQDE